MVNSTEMKNSSMYCILASLLIIGIEADAFGPPIAETKECKEDVQRLCEGLVGKGTLSNLAVLDCLQEFKKEDDMDLSPPCHTYVWNFKFNLTQDTRFIEAAQDSCGEDIAEIQDKKMCSSDDGDFLSCVIEHRDMVKKGRCQNFLNKMATILFSDFNYMKRFAGACKDDINKLKCGRLDPKETKGVQQGSTIECLSKHVRELSSECHLQTLRIAEMQADDYHLDRAVYFACRDDRENFCRQILAGDGRVYKCLMKNKMDPTMSQECREQLTRRQKLISQDFKASKGLVKFCSEDIKKYDCDMGSNKQKAVQLSRILVCLENAIHKGQPVANECQSEMLEHRESLLQDYRLSPEIVTNCENEIKNLCHAKGIGGKTIHCLMRKIRNQRRRPEVERVSDRCLRSVEDLLRETDTGTITWEADPVLKEACQSVVDRYCSRIRGNGQRVISCLMTKIGAEEMTSFCESTLMEIQYFASRDFRLDPQLYDKCHSDATKFCSAPQEWLSLKDNTPETSPLVLPCLYRYAYHPDSDKKLKDECLVEIRRVMRERAASVELQPDIEDLCLKDLTIFCLNKTGKGEEMLCLQENLEKLSDACEEAVSQFTEDESEDIQLNPIIVQACGAFLDSHCETAQDSGDEGEVMTCLIEEKMAAGSKMNSKCKQAIEHHQLISMKNYKFTFKFKQACKESVELLCPMSRRKADVVACLSERIRNDTMEGFGHKVAKDCRRQVKSLLFQFHEDINLNEELKTVCTNDRNSYCRNVTSGQGQVIECLKANRKNLSPGCHKAIFNIEKEEMEDNTLDASLNHFCGNMKRVHCMGVEEEEVLECLKDKRQEPGFDEDCLKLVIRRMVDQSLDIRLDPLFYNSCRLDIQKHCSEIYKTTPNEVELKGQVTQCLKDSFVKKESLTAPCENRLRKVIQESVLDSRLDPVLRESCSFEMSQFCSKEIEDEGRNKEDGSVEECLKKAFLAKQLRGSCNVLVARLVEASKVDIQADPILHKACSKDLLTKCNSIMPGEGRLVNCLMVHVTSNPSSLDPPCKELLELRVKLFDSSQKIAYPETLEQVYEQVANSPSKLYFLAMILVVFSIVFVFGLFFGRATKRYKELKSR